ncbi:MAG: hypothetical protein CSB34_06560 [Desulfobulbus propionicus]|nr:MAG: hypothetical protein CSB34_06560 [Desulfobulbus propionicus]
MPKLLYQDYRRNFFVAPQEKPAKRAFGQVYGLYGAVLCNFFDALYWWRIRKKAPCIIVFSVNRLDSPPIVGKIQW